MDCLWTVISSTAADTFDSITQLFGFIDKQEERYEEIFESIFEKVIWNTDC
jgi:hypothetical protein